LPVLATASENNANLLVNILKVLKQFRVVLSVGDRIDDELLGG
jgi:hypothetical protein